MREATRSNRFAAAAVLFAVMLAATRPAVRSRARPTRWSLDEVERSVPRRAARRGPTAVRDVQAPPGFHCVHQRHCPCRARHVQPQRTGLPPGGKAIPYGVDDLHRNEGWGRVGIDHDTATFAAQSIRRWRQSMGARRIARPSRW